MEECLLDCGEICSVGRLRDHIRRCPGGSSARGRSLVMSHQAGSFTGNKSRSSARSRSPIKRAVHTTGSRSKSPIAETTSEESDSELPIVRVKSSYPARSVTPPIFSSPSPPPLSPSTSHEDEVEEAMFQTAVKESLDNMNVDCPPQTLREVVSSLERKLIHCVHEVHVRRDQVLSDLMKEVTKRFFSPDKKLKTWFIGEAGKDTGGLTRELWRLFSKDLCSLCEGKDGCKVPRHDAAKLQNGDFKKIGMLMGISLIQGGSGFPFFAPSVYDYLSGKDLCRISIYREEIPDVTLAHTLEQITLASSAETLREVAMENCEVLLGCGFNKPLAKLVLQDVPKLIECVCLHATILVIKAELDHLRDGLNSAGVLSSLQAHPDLFKCLFVASESEPLTASQILELFVSKAFSEPGCADHKKEQNTYVFLRDFLEEVEGGDMPLDVGDVLAFFSGASKIPPTGFESNGTLNFSNVNIFPTASTCALILTLPTKYHDDYQKFKDKMIYAFCNHGGFGLH